LTGEKSMIIYEHEYNKDGYSQKEIEVKETPRQFRPIDRSVDFVGYASTLNKDQLDKLFTKYGIFVMYTLGPDKEYFLQLTQSELLKRIRSAEEILSRYEEDYNKFMQIKDTPA